MVVPAMAASRFAFLVHATMLAMSAIGGVRRMASPPRAERGELHPGRNTTMSTIVAGATSDRPSAIFPRFDGG